MSSIEQEIGSALTSDTVTAVELSALIIKVQEAIVAADAEAKRHQEAVYELASDPKAAHSAMEEAVISSGRLTTALTRLFRKRATVEENERLQAWESEFGPMTAQRDALVAELREAFAHMAKAAEVFARITKFEAELSKFHQSRPSGVPGYLLGVELEARGMEKFDRDNPSLLNGRDAVKLFSLSGNPLWPPQQKRDWALHSIPVIEAQFGGENWWKQEIHDARQAQVKAESDRVTNYYKREAEARAAREAAAEQEKWKTAGGAGK